MNRADELVWLQNWYLNNCDGLWEHLFGVKIDTLDNPGWKLSISSRGTDLEGQSFKRMKVDRTENDWVRCWVEAEKFEARSGPLNLGEAICIFRGWVENIEQRPVNVDPAPSPA